MNPTNECPYCLDVLEGAAETVECESCGAVYHRDCWEENGGCCVKSCKSVVKHIEIDLDDDVPEHLVLSRETVEQAKPHGPKRPNPCMKCGRNVPEGELYCPACKPEPPENQDAKNAGPLMIIVGLIAVLLAWMIIAYMVPGSTPSP